MASPTGPEKQLSLYDLLGRRARPRSRIRWWEPRREAARREDPCRELVYEAGEAILVLQEGRIRLANRKGAELFGLSEEELIGTPFAELVHPEDRSRVGQLRLGGPAAPGDPAARACRITAKGAKARWISLDVVASSWEGRPATLLTLAEGTAPAEGGPEPEAQTRVSLSAVHDFNNLMTAITGYAELLFMELSPEDPLRRRASQIRVAGERAVSLVQQFVEVLRKQSGRPVSEPVPAAVPAGSAAAREPHGKTVLVVDDEENVRGSIRQVLERNGFRVLLAGDGEEAMRVFRSSAGPIDLLLTDAVMPGVSGAELAERLCGRLPGLKVIYMSRQAENPSRLGGQVDGGAEILEKPFSPAQVATKVREILGSG